MFKIFLEKSVIFLEKSLKSPGILFWNLSGHPDRIHNYFKNKKQFLVTITMAIPKWACSIFWNNYAERRPKHQTMISIPYFFKNNFYIIRGRIFQILLKDEKRIYWKSICWEIEAFIFKLVSLKFKDQLEQFTIQWCMFFTTITNIEVSITFFTRERQKNILICNILGIWSTLNFLISDNSKLTLKY